MDARRMEVFTAIYKYDLSIHLQPCAMILDELSFESQLLENKIIFYGNGSVKWKLICPDAYFNVNAFFKTVDVLPKSMSFLSYSLFLEEKFTDLAYSEPLYLKEFQTVNSQK